MDRIVDLHTHGIDGADTRDARVPALLEIAQKQRLAGVSQILLSIYSAPIETMRDQIAAVARAMKEQSRNRPSGEGASTCAGQAEILGVHLEGPFLNRTRCGALDPGSFEEPEERLFRKLTEGFENIVRIVTIAPELKGACELIRAMARSGIAVNMGHSDATYTEAESGFRAGARGITHLFNGMRPFHHREPGIVGFSLVNREAYVEVIGDLVHVSPHALELLFMTKRRDRIILVSDSVRETKISQTEPPRGESGLLLGGSLSLPATVARLIDAGFDAEAVTRAATENPKEYLSL